MKKRKILVGLLLVSVAFSFQTAAVTASTSDLSPGTERASWLLQRGSWDDYALTGQRYEANDFGDTDKSFSVDNSFKGNDVSGRTGWAMLASLVLPGAGEALLGYKRGYAMMAADLLVWTQVAKYQDRGDELEDAYYAFADEHYSDEYLVLGYQPNALDRRNGLGMFYFSDTVKDAPINTVGDLHKLSLYVSVEVDRREYYENLGKWDQFIFGWKDFRSPLNPPPGIEYDVTDTIEDMRQPWISENREIYRQMRADANDAIKTRTQWLYVNMGLRVLSLLQVGYLGGLLGGSDSPNLEVSGYPVQIMVQPYGMTAGTVAAAVNF